MKNRLQSKNVLFDQGRVAPHFLTGLSSVLEKKWVIFEKWGLKAL
jgi:hypothetical protein